MNYKESGKLTKKNPILLKCPPHSNKLPQYTVFNRNTMLFCIYFIPATKTLHMFILFPSLPMVYSDTVSLIFEKILGAYRYFNITI